MVKSKQLNKDRVDDFWRKRSMISDPLVSTHFKVDDANEYDFMFIQQYLKPNYTVLDLGCGTCYVTRHIASEVKFVKGVDKHPEFLKKCPKIPNLITEISDIDNYTDDNLYDLILLFGVMNYFDEPESIQIYQNVRKMLKPDGRLLVKHACGVNEDVFVDKYSEQIGDLYLALYRHVDGEMKLLNQIFSRVEKFDIYPPHLNKWENTHYYAFVSSGSK